MEVVILDTGEVEFIEEGEGVLHMDVVVCDAVHYEEADVFLHGFHVGDGSVSVAGRVILWGVHVTFCVDRICGEKEMLIRKNGIRWGGGCGL